MPKRGQPTDPAIVAEIVRRYREGESSSKLMAEFGRSRTFVLGAVRAAGIVPAVMLAEQHRYRAQTDPAVLEKAVAMYMAGTTGRVAARELGISEAVIYRALHTRGVSPMALNRRGDRTHANRRFSDETETEIVRLYLEGQPLSQLADAYGVHLATIRNVLRRRETTRRPRGGMIQRVSPEQVEDMASRWEAGESQSKIAASLGISQTRVSRHLSLHGFTLETRRPVGERHGSWKGGRSQRDGYEVVAVPFASPFAAMRNTAGYVFEHRLVMAQALGRVLEPSETVHHINGDRADNRLENLQLRQGKHGKGAAFRCLDCGSHNITAVQISGGTR